MTRHALGGRRHWGWIACAGLLLLPACKDPISIQPSCPAELAVGESDQLMSGVQNPGAVPKYLWEVLPPEAGDLDDAAVPDPNFTAAEAGPAFLRLTASDGLFQVISECQTEITP